MLNRVSVSAFEACLGETFLIREDSSLVHEVKLIKAEALPARTEVDHPAIRKDPFSLRFEGSTDLELPQRIYVMEHPRLGSFELFLVPMGPRLPGQTLILQAIFN